VARPPIRSASAQRVRERIKALALDQIAAGGLPALSLNAVAAALGVSGPAMYRYYRNREALLTDLVVDAYRGLAGAVAPAVTPADFASAYRAWALAEPHRYRLLFGSPVPGYDAHSRPLVEASQLAMDELLRCLESGGPGPVPGLDPAQLAAWTQAGGASAAPDRAGTALAIWARLHGLASLEINGNFTSVGVDPGPLYADAVRSGPGWTEIP
jgi:AcrR family transcriptional regulator